MQLFSREVNNRLVHQMLMHKLIKGGEFECKNQKLIKNQKGKTISS